MGQSVIVGGEKMAHGGMMTPCVDGEADEVPALGDGDELPRPDAALRVAGVEDALVRIEGIGGGGKTVEAACAEAGAEVRAHA